MWMFIVALFITAPKLETAQVNSAGEWLNCGTYIHTRNNHSAIKIRKLLIHAVTWMDLQETIWVKKKSNFQMLHTI